MKICGTMISDFHIKIQALHSSSRLGFESLPWKVEPSTTLNAKTLGPQRDASSLCIFAEYGKLFFGFWPITRSKLYISRRIFGNLIKILILRCCRSLVAFSSGDNLEFRPHSEDFFEFCTQCFQHHWGSGPKSSMWRRGGGLHNFLVCVIMIAIN